VKLIRAAIDADPKGWKRASCGKKFTSVFELAGDSLKRAPKGYDPEHPLIEDLRRKDFIAVTNLTQKQVTAPGFIKDFAGLCKTGSPLIEFLCEAIGVPF
jgi:uncharacterized protein (TIGR02453 family)